MKTRDIVVAAFCVLLAGCGPQGGGSAEGQSGSGAVYGRGGAKDEKQSAAESATDTRPRGGSMAGAGGAGPGYDGSGRGLGEHGTVPAPGSGVGAGITATNTATNQLPTTPTNNPQPH